MSVNLIKSVLNSNQGPSQPCNYIVTIVPPTGFFTGEAFVMDAPISFAAPVFSSLSTVGIRQLSLLAESASIPGRNIETTPHQIFGTKRQMPYGVTFDTMSITFICTNLMTERAFFDMWQQYIISPKSQYMNYYDSYVGAIVIQKTDTSDSFGSELGGAISIYTLEEAYPKTIQAQELSYSATDEYMKLTVEFSYARFRTSLDRVVGIGEDQQAARLRPIVSPTG